VFCKEIGLELRSGLFCQDRVQWQNVRFSKKQGNSRILTMA
jgi:hypothetical protein